MARASIIVVSWNGEAYLGACLDAIMAQVGAVDEVIVVDNASTDASVALAHARYPQVRLVENNRNLGFAGGLNVGLRVAQGDFLISVNQDVKIHQGWLEALLEALAAPGVGIAGCKLFYPDGTIQHAGGIIHWPQALADHYGYHQPDDGRWDELRSVDYVTGAAWGFRRAVMEQLGLLDEGYWPGYYEEVDYCFRACKAGWQVVYTPRATGVHYESASLKHGSAAYLEAFHRGRVRFVFKNCGVNQIKAEFLPAEQRCVYESSVVPERRMLARAYLSTLMTMPDLSDGERAPAAQGIAVGQSQALIGEVIAGLSGLYLFALHAPPKREEHMDDQAQPIQFPALHEHDFYSSVPIVGPLVQLVRRFLYGLAARWGVLAVIHQQTQINQRIAAYLQEYEARLVDQDRDLAYLARTVAELEIRQRYLARRMLSQAGPASQDDATSTTVDK